MKEPPLSTCQNFNRFWDIPRRDRRTIILIDDVDRLAPGQVRQLFRVVKALGSLPNVTYVVAFDRKVVTDALDREYPGSGAAFLEKIVQVSFAVPLPDPAKLARLFDNRINQIIAPIPEHRWDDAEFQEIWHQGISGMVRTPRDVSRYCNALAVSLGAMGDEVFVSDLIGIEALRVFSPETYEIVRDNPETFAGRGYHVDASSERERATKFLNAHLDSLPEDRRAYVRRILLRLFASVEWALSNRSHDDDSYDRWEKEHRVRTRTFFHRYFQLSLRSSEISDHAMSELLSVATDGKAFGGRLLAHAERIKEGGAQPQELVRALRLRVDRLTHDQIRGIFSSLWSIGDQLWALEGEPTLDLLARRIEQAMSGLSYDLLMQIDPGARTEFVIKMFDSCSAHSTMSNNVRWWISMATKPPRDGERPFDDSTIVPVRERALEHIRALAESGAILDVRDRFDVLFAWRDCGSTEEVQEWLVPQLADRDFVVWLIAAGSTYSTEQGMSFHEGGSIVPRRVPRIARSSLHALVDEQVLVEAVRTALASPGISREAEALLRRYLDPPEDE